MARPKTDLPDAAAVRALVDGEGRLAVRVTPGAKTEGLVIEQGRLLAKVRAKPQDGAANKAVAGLIAKALGCAPSKVELSRGATSREKQFRVS
ncbi:DUF167 domain-containing protein [Aurantiacibacter gilvus]|uniref:UPF0235 protein AAEO60_13995 n=1 Tax=Aurantiacibacter gilvus TaxID=3139141 RepID=A0ABU9IIC5_9SPHN